MYLLAAENCPLVTHDGSFILLKQRRSGAVVRDNRGERRRRKRLKTDRQALREALDRAFGLIEDVEPYVPDSPVLVFKEDLTQLRKVIDDEDQIDAFQESLRKVESDAIQVVRAKSVQNAMSTVRHIFLVVAIEQVVDTVDMLVRDIIADIPKV